MHLLDTSASLWRIGKKTKTLRAKPMVNLLVDRTVMARFLVDTLEWREPVSADAMFCIGRLSVTASSEIGKTSRTSGWFVSPSGTTATSNSSDSGRPNGPASSLILDLRR